MSIDFTPERKQELVDAFSEIETQVNKTNEAVSNNARLVAVSKLKPASDIHALYQHGVRHFGENYPQELVDKAKELPEEIRWHFIGALQSNKCKMLASIPNLFAIETLTSIKSADSLQKTLSTLSPPRSSPLNIFIQINTSGEDNKSGLPPLSSSSGNDEIASSPVVDLARHLQSQCPLLNLKGLMTIGSFDNSTAEGEDNPDFTRLAESRAVLARTLGVQEGTLELSMGMSEDFVQAIKQGSSNVRVGSSIFGKRPPRN